MGRRFQGCEGQTEARWQSLQSGMAGREMTFKVLMLALLGVLLVLVVVTLRRRDRASDSPIKLEDLLLGEDGRISKAAAVMMGAFALTSWAIAYLAVNDKLTEGYFGAYLAAWVAPTVTRLIVN